MNDSRCLICKYLGDHSHKDLSRDRIFREKGQDIVISLCYSHSWELFRQGQRRFLNKYQDNFMVLHGTEAESELISYLKRGTKTNIERWAA